MPSASDVCPLCGKHPADHPSISSSGYATFGAFDDFDDPGPELGGTPAPSAQVVHAPFDAFQDEPPPPAGLFEVEAPPRPKPAAPALAPPSNPIAASRPASPPASSQHSPPALQVDPYEVAILADYGPAPEQFFLTPLYAWRVLSRRRELKRRLAVADRAVAQAERARDDRLADLAEGARPTVEKSPEFATLLQPLVAAEQSAADRASALALRNAEFAKQVGTVDQQIADAQQKVQAAQAVVDAARRQLAAKEEVLRRAQALVKRVEIELRNTQELARTAAGPNAKTAPPEFARQLAALQQELETRRAECEAPQTSFDQALAEVRQAEQSLSTLDRTVRGLRAERSRIEQTYSREASLRSEGVQRAESDRRNALIAIGIRLVETQLGMLDPARREAWSCAQAELAARTLEAEKLRRALDSDDKKAVRTGLTLMAVAAVIAVGVIAALIWALGSSTPT
jgi:hypothetical protein